MSFYDKCRIERYKKIHNDQEQKKRLCQWYENLFKEMKNGECDERRHEERTKLDLNQSRNETIKVWILGSLKTKTKI